MVANAEKKGKRSELSCENFNELKLARNWMNGALVPSEVH